MGAGAPAGALALGGGGGGLAVLYEDGSAELDITDEAPALGIVTALGLADIAAKPPTAIMYAWD